MPRFEEAVLERRYRVCWQHVTTGRANRWRLDYTRDQALNLVRLANARFPRRHHWAEDAETGERLRLEEDKE